MRHTFGIKGRFNALPFFSATEVKHNYYNPLLNEFTVQCQLHMQTICCITLYGEQQ